MRLVEVCLFPVPSAGEAGAEIVTSPSFALAPEATSRRAVPPNEQDRAALVVVIELGQFGFPAYGAYSIEMLLDGTVIASKELAVIRETGTARRVFSTNPRARTVQTPVQTSPPKKCD
jgi:hypothetical protein